MKTIRLLMILVLMGCFFGVTSYASETDVRIEKTKDREGAFVQGPALEKKTKQGFLDKLFTPLGDGLLGVARGASHSAGVVSDAVILSVQKVGDFSLAPIFRALDIKKHLASEKKNTAS